MKEHRVFKYPLALQVFVQVSLPVGTKLIHLGEQDASLFVWALVDPAAPLEERYLRIAGTGHAINHDGRYVGTVQMTSGLVWHVFEVTQDVYERAGET